MGGKSREIPRPGPFFFLPPPTNLSVCAHRTVPAPFQECSSSRRPTSPSTPPPCSARAAARCGPWSQAHLARGLRRSSQTTMMAPTSVCTRPWNRAPPRWRCPTRASSCPRAPSRCRSCPAATPPASGLTDLVSQISSRSENSYNCSI